MSSRDYYDNFLKLNSEGICCCGKETKFYNLNIGYSNFCSTKCSNTNKETKEKAKKTCLKKYGVKHHMLNDGVKDKIKQTNLNKYGAENPYGSKRIREKIKQTNLERYGVENISQSEEMQKKKRQNSIKKYGVNHPWKSEEVQEKRKQTNLERYGAENISQSKHYKDKLIKNSRISHKDSLPLFNYYAQKISWIEEVRRDPEDNDILNVKCKKCNEWFVPDLRSLKHRVQTLKGNYKGENNLYCSDDCKNSCSIFNKSLYQEDHPKLLEQIRHPEWVKMIKERANYICEICESEQDLVAHHIKPVKTHPHLANDIGNGICVCSSCHKKYGHKDECSTENLAKKVC
jgi:hypothetical protein